MLCFAMLCCARTQEHEGGLNVTSLEGCCKA